MIEFLAEWMVTLLMPASHVLDVRAPHLSFMMLKEYWFRELYLGLKVTASFDRTESFTRVNGQARCITPEVKPQNLQVIWNVQFITVFVPAWMIPPVYHSLRRERIKTASSASPIGVQSVRPTWFEDTTPKDTTSQSPQDPQKGQPQPLHGLKLVIREEVLPANDQPQFRRLSFWLAEAYWHLTHGSANVLKSASKQLLMSPCWVQSQIKMVTDSWKTLTCLWDGHSTSMALSDNVVFTEC